MTVKRQFIAGATCPECGAMDKIQRCQDEERSWMYCLACEMELELGDEPKEETPEPDVDAPQAVIWKEL